jgi:hypothetical protein
MTTATLGFAIDSSPASSAAVDLEKLTASAVKTETSVGRLEQAARGLGTALGAAGKGADGAKAPVEQLGKSFGSQDQHVQAFRMELERLTAKYQPLAQATRQYEASVGEINRAHQLGIISAQQMQKALDSERMAYDRLKQSAQSAGQAVQAANQNQSGRGGQSFNASNAGYQFQDIAVTAAMGMNPLMIGLQQGTQLASVVSSMERPVAGLAAAFASIISPVSLVTIGLTAGVAALIQYFSTADEGTGKTSKLFEEQNEIIRQAAELWGDAVPGLKAYVDELDRADKITSGKQAGEILAGRELEGLSENLDSISRQGREAFAAMRGDPNNAVIVRDLRTAWSELKERLDGGTASMADLNNVQNQLTNALQNTGLPKVKAFKDAFDEVTDAIYRGVQAAQEARTAYIAALAGGSNVQDILAGSTFTDGGRTYRPSDFMPVNPGVPTSRPKIELEGMPGGGDQSAPTIINSDGRLVSVPVPGQKPNYFEREQDLPKSAFGIGSGRTPYWSREVLDEEQRRAALGGLFKGFITDFGDALRNNSGDLGKALMEGLSSAAMNAASQAFEKFANLGANMLVNAVLGQPSQGLMNKGIGFTGANTTLGQILGAGGGMSANYNVPGGFTGLGNSAVTRMPLGDIGSYAKAIQSIESGGNYKALGPVTRNGDRAYGAYQMMGNNIGPWSKEALGRSVSADEFLQNPSMQDQIFQNKFGGYVDKFGPSGAAQAWFGGPGSVGKGGAGADILGTTGTAYVDKFNSALGDASENVGTFGSGLGKIGETLSTSMFPSAPSAPGGAGGGWLSSLGGLFGGGGQNLSKYVGLTGLFATGTNNAPAGYALVGEDGPELVKFRGGEQVHTNNKSRDMMSGGAKSNGSNQRPKLEVHVHGAKTDAQIREMSRQGAQEAIYAYNEGQINGGFGETQKKFNSRMG